MTNFRVSKMAGNDPSIKDLELYIMVGVNLSKAPGNTAVQPEDRFI